ncbi:Gfo/Idh/MocA family oxidoreductase [Bacillus timonensis]|uniref:Gfo/Idh/MocA family oxidoreductase n=1 Tax=Bacillus timonensis TaxID=1033734 RepID=A0A4S3PUY2_9BACI|nr:Gfo/Idh/MocA family oxidoreductase [Bacillus timonensis]THE13611.1 Gfo/Idh/MocA family oxidoreductase [Bacillus timonensis]
MKIGIISFAHMHANSYAAAIKEMAGVTLTGIADENEERGSKSSQLFDTVYYKNYQHLLDSDIDAVIVTSENNLHHQHVIAAAKAGKHVLCEKPLATNLKDIEEMIRVCKQNGVLLGTAFPVRFNTPIQHAKKVLEEGVLGDILAIKGTNRGTNPGGWFIDKAKSGGGAVLDHTVHVVDIMRWFTGAEVKEVYAEIGNVYINHQIDDCGILTMEFTNGMFATLDCSWSRNSAYPTWGDVTMEIIGTNGTLKIDAFSQKFDFYSNQEGVNWIGWGDDMDTGLIEDFIASVREGRAPLATGHSGMKAVEVALAAYQSFEKKAPVKLI